MEDRAPLPASTLLLAGFSQVGKVRIAYCLKKHLIRVIKEQIIKRYIIDLVSRMAVSLRAPLPSPKKENPMKYTYFSAILTGALLLCGCEKGDSDWKASLSEASKDADRLVIEPLPSDDGKKPSSFEIKGADK